LSSGRKPAPWRGLAPILIVAAGVIAYCNSVNGPFIFDDIRAIENNESIRALWPPQRALIAPPGNTFAARPIANLSFAISYAMFGLDVRGYHVTNIALHLCAALVLYGVLRRTFRLPRLRERFARDADAIALAVTLLWEVHPMLTEAVTYISTRTEVLMGLCFLLTFYCAARAFGSPRPGKWYALAVAACVIGMGCKEVMVAAPLLVFLYDALLVHDGSFLAPLRRRPIFYGALAATWIITPLLLLVLTDLTKHTGQGLGSITPWHYLLTQSGVIVHYFRLALWPNALAIDHFDWPIAQSIAQVWMYALIVLAALAVTVWGLVRRRPWALLGAWVFVILAPTSSFVPLGSEVVAERRMYLPMIALLTGLVLLARRMIGPQRGVGAGIVAVLVIVLTIATLHRNADYATAVSIWSDTVEKRPRDMRALSELARVLAEQGRQREARAMAERVLAIDPSYPGAHATVGGILIGENRFDEATAHLREAVRLEPGNALARTNLGLALARQGKIDDAIATYREVLSREPNFVDAHVYLADALAEKGETAEALQHLETAMRLQPNAPDIRARYQRLK
jgi:tetratricopeptide (TPR) repeat protein